jgi:5,5'-dehydrodivanillate O-demethylase
MTAMELSRSELLGPVAMRVGPDGLAGQLLRRFWQPVFLSANLPAGKAKPLKVFDEEFTIYRGESGKAHLIAPYCVHRGLRLSTGWVEGDCVRCFYHGWKYDGGGQCVEQPAEKGTSPAGVRIASYPVREYLGLVFAYLGPGDPPAFPEFDAFHQPGTFCDTKQSRRKWSFFDQLENSVDEVHFNFVHRRSKFSDVGLNDEIPELDCEETDYGILRLGKRGDSTRRSHILMPNCMYSMVFEHFKGWAEHLSWRVPIDDETHTSFIVDCVHKDGAEAEAFRKLRVEHRASLKELEPSASVIARIMAGDLHIDDVPWRPDIVMIQDAVAIGGLRKPRNRTSDVLGASDRQVVLLRRLWRRELEALQAGHPIKMWMAPRDLVPTPGTEADTD